MTVHAVSCLCLLFQDSRKLLVSFSHFSETIPYCHGPGHWHLSEKPAEDSEVIWRELPFLQVQQPLCASQGLSLLSSTQHSLSSEALLSYKADPIS